MSELKFSNQLDLKGLDCPLPVLKTKKFLANLTPGAIIDVITTDPASLFDLQDFCTKTGHILLEQKQEHGVIYTQIKHR